MKHYAPRVGFEPTKAYTWIDNRRFADDAGIKESQKKLLTQGLRGGLGPISVAGALGLVAVRMLLIVLLVPDWYAPVEPAHFRWYVGGDLLVSFATITTFWLLLLTSYLLFRILGAAAVRVEDPFSYKESYEDIGKLANHQIIVTSSLVGFFLAGITYWASFTRAVVSALFLVGSAAIGTLLVFLLNAYSIHRGIETSKRTRIHEIRGEREEAGALGTKEIRISFHAQVSSWQLGFGFGKTFLIALLTSELVTIATERSNKAKVQAMSLLVKTFPGKGAMLEVYNKIAGFTQQVQNEIIKQSEGDPSKIEGLASRRP